MSRDKDAILRAFWLAGATTIEVAEAAYQEGATMQQAYLVSLEAKRVFAALDRQFAVANDN